MRLLVLSFYYSPDLSAGSFRATALVAALRDRVPADAQIDVLTTLPNRYSTFAAEASHSERSTGLEIRRIRLPSHSSDMLGQARAFSRYATAAYRYTRSRNYDIVFATSSRLMTAALGAVIARRTNAPLYLDIRDIFVDTIKDVLPTPIAAPARALFDRIEQWTMSRAETINLVSGGFSDYFTSRYPKTRLSWFTNGIDDEFVAAADGIDPTRRPSRPVRVLYAGNIGEGQGLHAIVPQLARQMSGDVAFVIVGDGGRREELVNRLSAAGVQNVELRRPIGRDSLIQEYRRADVLLLHLNAYEAFEKVLPSKVFEYAAMGKPIWAGVAGFAADFLRREVKNAAVFRPCDANDAVRAFAELDLVDARRERFVAKYARAGIAQDIAEDVLGTAVRWSSGVRDSVIE